LRYFIEIWCADRILRTLWRYKNAVIVKFVIIIIIIPKRVLSRHYNRRRKYRVDQNKIPHNISTTRGLILKILEAA